MGGKSAVQTPQRTRRKRQSRATELHAHTPAAHPAGQRDIHYNTAHTDSTLSSLQPSSEYI